jgi:pimeloyl-ACP methyl ester carboxylesterase
MPIRLVWGARERLLPPAHREFFARYLPGHARIECPPDFGHAPFLDRPDEVTALLQRFAVNVAIDRETQQSLPSTVAALH